MLRDGVLCTDPPVEDTVVSKGEETWRFSETVIATKLCSELPKDRFPDYWDSFSNYHVHKTKGRLVPSCSCSI